MADTVSPEPMDLQLTTDPQIQEQLLAAIRLSKGDLASVAYALYSVLGRQPEPHRTQLLRFIAEHWDEAIANRTEQIAVDVAISSNQQEELKGKYEQVIWSMLTALVDQNLDEDLFYSKLWSLIDNPFLDSEQSKAYALYKILINKRIPYFKIGTGLKMSDTEWRQRIQQLRLPMAKVRFITIRTFDQRSERADLLLKTILEHDEIDRVVLMAYLLSEVEVDDAKLLDLLKQVAP